MRPALTKREALGPATTGDWRGSGAAGPPPPCPCGAGRLMLNVVGRRRQAPCWWPRGATLLHSLLRLPQHCCCCGARTPLLRAAQRPCLYPHLQAHSSAASAYDGGLSVTESLRRQKAVAFLEAHHANATLVSPEPRIQGPAHLSASTVTSAIVQILTSASSKPAHVPGKAAAPPRGACGLINTRGRAC